jgi:hypothetical protein
MHLGTSYLLTQLNELRGSWFCGPRWTDTGTLGASNR